MLTAVCAVPSEVQDLTQNNREVKMTQTAFMSKGELRKTIESMDFEHSKLRREIIRLNDKLLQRQEEMINSYRDSSHLKVAI